MINIVTKIMVHGKSASQISDWLLNLDRERYLQWHPDHKDYKFIKQLEVATGSTYYFDEIIDGFRIKYKWEVVEIKKNESLLTKATFFYPLYLSISLREIDQDTEVTHDVRIGFVYLGIEKPIDWLIRQLLLNTKRAKSVARHAIEEFKNLEWLIT